MAMLKRLVSGAAALALAIPAAGLAQIASAPVEGAPEATTVSPLISSPLAPVPEVGRGATYLFPEELGKAAQDAARAARDAKFDARSCGLAGVGPSEEVFGSFGVGALVDSTRVAETALQQAALKAQRTTQAALDARLAAARGEKGASVEATELARQEAVRAYQAANAAALEAHRRVADLQDLMFTDRTATRGDLKAMVDNRSYEREQTQGATNVYIPNAYKDLRLTEVVAREAQDKGEAVVRVSGKIVNTRKQSIAVPPLWLSVVDKYGTSLKSEQAQAPRGQKRIPAGGTLSFNYEVKAPPRTARTVVTFAPFHRPPMEQPIGAYCRG